MHSAVKLNWSLLSVTSVSVKTNKSQVDNFLGGSFTHSVIGLIIYWRTCINNFPEPRTSLAAHGSSLRWWWWWWWTQCQTYCLVIVMTRMWPAYSGEHGLAADRCEWVWPHGFWWPMGDVRGRPSRCWRTVDPPYDRRGWPRSVMGSGPFVTRTNKVTYWHFYFRINNAPIFTAPLLTNAMSAYKYKYNTMGRGGGGGEVM